MRMIRLGFLLFVAFGGALLAAGKVSKGLENVRDEESIDVIVQFKQPVSDKHHERFKGKGAKVRHHLAVINGGAYTLRGRLLREIANDDSVEFISPDYEVAASLDYTAETVGAELARQYGYTGKGVGVAVVDSGIVPHADLRDPASGASRIVYLEDFVGEGWTSDGYGHGTHVAGIVAGNGTRSSGTSSVYRIQGMAPGAHLINLKALGKSGKGSDSSVIAAINRAIQLKAQYNIRVLNLSLGRPVYQSYTVDPLCRAVEAAWRAGIVVVVAAGNNGRDTRLGTMGYGTITAPGNDPYVITVGAVKTGETAFRSDDTIASYSSKGPALFDYIVKPDLVAPGNRIVSLQAANSTLAATYPQNKLPKSAYIGGGYGSSSDYFVLSGTSMATPVVSGAVALLLEKYPNLTPHQVKARLMKTAYKQFPSTGTFYDPLSGRSLTSWYDVFTYGAGELNIWDALSSSASPTGAAFSPKLGYDPSGPRIVALYGVEDPAAKSLVWGSSLVWGASIVWGSSVVWGESLVWGSSVQVSPTSIVWGASVAWGHSLPQSFSIVWGVNAPAPPEAESTWVLGER